MIMHNTHELELTSWMSEIVVHEPYTIHHFDVIFWQYLIHKIPYITLWYLTLYCIRINSTA